MVQSAEDRRRDQPGGPGDRSLGLGLGNRRVAIETLVRPGGMVVCLDGFPHESLQMAEVAIPRGLFRAILERIRRLKPPSVVFR